MSTEVLEHTSVTTDDLPPVTPPKPNKSTRGGYRPGGGRPKKVVQTKAPVSDSLLPALPAASGGVTKSIKFFEFWAALSETQLSQTLVYINRDFPVCDAKIKDPDAPKYIDKIVGPCPCLPGEYKDYFLRKYGTGDYRLYFNEGSANRIRIEVSVRDYENYPPQIDFDTLMVNDKANKDFVRWAKSHGFAEEIRRLEGGATPKGDDEEMNAALIEQHSKLTDTVVEMARERRDIPQAAPPPRESQTERKAMDMIDEAGKASFRMIEKAIELTGSKNTVSADPLEQIKAIAELARTFSHTNNGEQSNSVIVEMLRDSLTEARAELREIRNTRSEPIAPQSLADKLAEIQALKGLFEGTFGGKEEAEVTKPGSPKAMLLEMLVRNGPQLLTAAIQGIQTLVYTAKVMTAKEGTAIPQPPMATAPNPTIAPPSNDAQSEMAFFLRMVEGSIKKHMNEWASRDFPGADFAEWLIDSQTDGRLTYEGLKSLGSDQLKATLLNYPPLAQMINAMPERFDIFVQQFLTLDEIRAKQEADEDGDDTEEATP